MRVPAWHDGSSPVCQCCADSRNEAIDHRSRRAVDAASGRSARCTRRAPTLLSNEEEAMRRIWIDPLHHHCRYRRHSRRCRHSLPRRHRLRGLTLLEIMIVIAILGLVMGLVVVPRVMGLFVESNEHIAKLTVDKLAFQEAPQWQVSSGKPCPDSLLTIAQFVGKGQETIVDPWGTPYELFCGGENMPPGATGASFAVMSYGRDKKKGTEDDIKSWEPAKKP
jgi:general secretion pathway protein G